MKNSIYFYSFWILLLLVSCSSEEGSKSEITQYPMILANGIQESLKEENLIAKSTEISLKEVIPSPPDFSDVEYEEEPPPPPDPEPWEPEYWPEPEIYTPEETMEETWQRVVHLSRNQTTRADQEFCFIYGDTLIKQGRYKEARLAYEKSEELNMRFTYKTYLGFARIDAIKGYYHHIEDYLKRAISEGFKDYNYLLYHKDFEGYRGWNDFLSSYERIFRENKTAMFEAFIVFAPKKNLTEVYDLSPVNLFENVNARNSAYYNEHARIYTCFSVFAKGAEENSFGRRQSGNCRYEMCLAGTKNYRAIIYSVEEQWSEYILPKKYYLVTYDLKGNKISELELAARGSLKTCKGFTLRPDKSLVVSKYAVKWKLGSKYSLKKNGFLNHEHIKKTILKSTQAYQITDSGRLVEMEDLLVLNDR
jgi:tetratricopeptide (TPR) repeat protein